MTFMPIEHEARPYAAANRQPFPSAHPHHDMAKNETLKSVGILWVQYGPYHCARFAALKRRAEPAKVHALEFSNRTSVYAWNRSEVPKDLITLCPGSVAEELSFLQVFRQARRTFAELKLDVCFLPSYAPRQPLAAFLAAKSLGIRTVMMNESHAGTSRAKGLAAAVKRRLVGLFDTALVGGDPQKRYIAELGLPEKKIFTGYDAVDNDYFARRSEEIRSRDREIRAQYQLPDHYFLSLGRFVAKKNSTSLIKAYRQVLDSRPASQTHLVLVGSGDQEAALRSLCQQLQLPVYDKTESALSTPHAALRNEPPGVHFYGFRQVTENPVFYALADAFVLPSLYEEWGLVVNEAMACGLPVLVSKTAGCAEDLLVRDRITLSSGLSPDLQSCLAQLAGHIRQNGFLFDPNSIKSLANAMRVLEAVPAIRESMGLASRRIIEHFSCANFAANALRAANAALGEAEPATLQSSAPNGH
jgi:glycosyltransferase involved in cell wall biosynthesis